MESPEQNQNNYFPKKNRSDPNDVFEIKKIKNQKKWTKEEDELLIELSLQYKEKHWKEISEHFIRKNALQCFSRYKRIKPGIVKGSWKKEEDTKIMELVHKYGKVWSRISKILGTRNGKQIRDRYINVLDPEIKKGKFTLEEDEKLIELYLKYGPKWATIAKFYSDRTADMVKNRFHSSVKKRIAIITGQNVSFFSEENSMKLETRHEHSYLKSNSYSDDIILSPVKDDLFRNEKEDPQQNFFQTFIHPVNLKNESEESSNETQTIINNLEDEKPFKNQENFLGNTNDDLLMWNFEDYFCA